MGLVFMIGLGEIGLFCLGLVLGISAFALFGRYLSWCLVN